MLLILQLLVLLRVEFCNSFNDFPSLMIANATMANGVFMTSKDINIQFDFRAKKNNLGLLFAAVVIERAFFERTAVRRRHIRNAYEKKLEAFSRAINEAVKAETADTTAGIEINVYQDTNVNLARDYTVLLSVASCDETWNLFRRARKEKLVHLAITDRDCPRLPTDHGMSVPIVDPGQELPQIFLDLRMARILNWKKINLLHDDVFERETIGRTLRALSGEIPNKPILGLKSESLFSTHSADSESATKRLIVEALSRFPSHRRSDDRYLFVVAHDIVPAIVEAARSLEMLHPESQWLFILPDSAEVSLNVTDFSKLLGEGENVAFIYNETKFNEDCEADPECYAKEMAGALAAAVLNALKQEIELYERFTEEEFDAVRMTKAERSREMVVYIRNKLYSVRGDSGSWNKCGECMTWRMMAGITWGNSFARKTETDPHQLIDVGSWTPGPGSVPKETLFPHSKYGFRGKSLPIVTYHNPPWQFATKSKVTGKPKWGGLVFDIVDQLSRKLNFTYKLLEIDIKEEKDRSKAVLGSGNRSDSSIGGKEFVRSSTLSGEKFPKAVRELVSGGRVFMAACASTVTEHLKSSINFTLPISIQTYGLLASRPKQLSRAMLFASPYTPESWACLACGILLIGPILYLVNTYSPNPRTHEARHASLGLGSPARCLWYIYGALLQQGGMHIPQNDGARLIVGTWWLVVMILVATYSGSLVAFLTFPRMAESISSVEDLLRRRGEFTWSLPAKSFIEEYLSNGESGGIYDGLLGDQTRPAERHDSSNYKGALIRVKEGKHVLVDWTTSLRTLMRMDNPLINDGACHFSIGSEAFVEEPIALLLPSNSPYMSLINTELKRMHETGLIGKWTAERMPMRDQCWEGPGSNREVNNHKVDVWDMQGIFFVLFFGYLIALVVFIWEFYSHHRKLSKERKLIRPFVS